MPFSDFLSSLNSEQGLWSSLDFARWLRVGGVAQRPLDENQVDPERQEKRRLATSLLEQGLDIADQAQLIVKHCAEPKVARADLGARFAELPDLMTRRGTPVLLDLSPENGASGQVTVHLRLAELLRATISCNAFGAIHYWVIEMNTKNAHLHALSRARQALEGSQAFAEFVAFLRGREEAA